MSDIKLFRTSNSQVVELEGKSVSVEKSLQKLIENHLEALLGVRFLASEHSTGKKHGGRIDTLGIDENNSPVIIEYKRALNENVINQGLYYLDWLLDHKGEFTLRVMRRFGKEVADAIEWDNARLLCIAGEYTKYDEYAVRQISRNIELIRYRRYGEDFLLLELVNATTAHVAEPEPSSPEGEKYTTVTELLEKSSPELKDRLEKLKAFTMALGDDVQMKTLKYITPSDDLKTFCVSRFAPKLTR